MRTKKTKVKRKLNLAKAKRKVVKAQVAFKEIAYDAKDKFIVAEKNVAAYTKYNPLKAMSFSLLAGLALAQFLHFHK